MATISAWPVMAWYARFRPTGQNRMPARTDGGSDQFTWTEQAPNSRPFSVYFGGRSSIKPLSPSQDPNTLNTIREHLARIREYRRAGRTEFMENPLVQNAILFHWEQLGIQFQLLSPAFHRRAPGFPLKRFTALRNRIAHDETNIDLELAWKATESLLPVMERWLGGPSLRGWPGTRIEIPERAPNATPEKLLGTIDAQWRQVYLLMTRLGDNPNLKSFQAPANTQVRDALAHTLVIMGTAAHNLSLMNVYDDDSPAQATLRELAQTRHLITHPELYPQAQEPQWLWLQLQAGLPNIMRRFYPNCMQPLNRSTSTQSQSAPAWVPAWATH
jgi:uncharacterized protein with HEPN domain